MDCREVRTHITGFVEGTYEIKNLEEYIWHLKNCPECSEEIADRLRLNMALEAFEEDLRDDMLLDVDAGNRFQLIMDRARSRLSRYHRYRRFKTGLFTAAYWAVALAFILQIMFWRYVDILH